MGADWARTKGAGKAKAEAAPMVPSPASAYRRESFNMTSPPLFDATFGRAALLLCIIVHNGFKQ